jgi:hypothetical protein
VTSRGVTVGPRGSYEETGTIAFSDPMLTAVQQLVKASAMSNFQSVPTDCPQRERRGWLGEWALSLGGNTNGYPFFGYIKFAGLFRLLRHHSACRGPCMGLPGSLYGVAVPWKGSAGLLEGLP